jgi:betaine-aldehyde dehydrogenase
MRCQPIASHFVGGSYCDDPDGAPFESRYPATNEVIAQLNAATPAFVDRVVAAAREAQIAWGALPGRERGRVLRRAADLMRERNRELSVLETLDTGKALQETLVADAASGADCLEYFGGLAAAIEGVHVDLGGPFLYTRREPLGVVASIGAWNYPIQIASWKAAPALAAGNAVIFKPAETTPLSALKLAEILKEAGLPDGVFNVVQGFAETGRALTRHPGIAKVSLTGESATGKAVMTDAATTLKQVTLELGGKSPLIVFDDAHLDNAVSAAMLANFYSTGQICSNGTRVFVQRQAKDAFLDRLVERTRKIRLGDPLDEATQLGPLVTHEHREKVLSYLAIGKAEGARLMAGGGVPQMQGLDGGAFVEPTIFADVTDGMRIAREEIFGPVMCVLDFDDEDEVIARANDTIYGLAAGVFTRDIARAHRVIGKVKAGTTWINTYNLTPVEMPFGGMKQSGLGRENGRAALDAYTQVKSVYVETGDVWAPY